MSIPPSVAIPLCPYISTIHRCSAGLAGRRTYISPFSNRFFKLSLIASLEILLIRVRSETPTSFFLVVSKTAFFANWDVGWPPLAAGFAAAASFLRPARFDTAYTMMCQRMRLCSRDIQAWYHNCCPRATSALSLASAGGVLVMASKPWDIDKAGLRASNAGFVRVCSLWGGWACERKKLEYDYCNLSGSVPDISQRNVTGRADCAGATNAQPH
jgi:hypothetical protein